MRFVNAPFVKAGNECIQNQLLSYNEDLIDRTGCDCRADCGGTHFFASETRNSYTDKSLADIDKYISQVTNFLAFKQYDLSNFVLWVAQWPILFIIIQKSWARYSVEIKKFWVIWSLLLY